MATLIEKYQPRINVANEVYAKSHDGEKMDRFKQMVLARCLENVNNYLNESFGGASQGTQLADMGKFKIFTMNLTNMALN